MLQGYITVNPKLLLNFVVLTHMLIFFIIVNTSFKHEAKFHGGKSCRGRDIRYSLPVLIPVHCIHHSFNMAAGHFHVKPLLESCSLFYNLLLKFQCCACVHVSASHKTLSLHTESDTCTYNLTTYLRTGLITLVAR